MNDPGAVGNQLGSRRFYGIFSCICVSSEVLSEEVGGPGQVTISIERRGTTLKALQTGDELHLVVVANSLELAIRGPLLGKPGDLFVDYRFNLIQCVSFCRESCDHED